MESQENKIDDGELLALLMGEIACVTTNEIPNRRAKETLGIVRGFSAPIGSGNEFKNADREALFDMLRNAKEIGANGVVGTKISSISYELIGSKWHISQIVYYGTAVKV
ncbi:MAG: YbjQ family protein [Helicobacteraceae bacterium]|nr:YbjQ family protein [Helicobacteraceae bacterium]